MNCLVCRGACCETIVVMGSMVGDLFPAATQEWMAARSIGRAASGGYVIEARCPKLTADGLCSIHDDKPLACALGIVGGTECLESVASRRTPEQYALIRDDDDPEVLHESGLQSSSPRQ